MKPSKKIIFFFLSILLTFSVSSQQSEIDVNLLADFNHAVKLYNNKAYAAAQQNFIKVTKKSESTSNIKADAFYYDAMCAIKLNQTDADKKVKDFVENHPTSNKKDKAFLNVGNYYFSNKRASHALKWYTKVNDRFLSDENKKELNFKMGYALLVNRNLSLARNKFLPLINDARYGNDSRYYYGYIAYKQEDYDVAETTLTEIANNESYKSEVSYYLLDISFKAGRFERCIDVGEKLLPKASKKEKSEISKIVGESYFNLKKYKEAIPYLKTYKGKRGKWNNTDYYILGYAYYKQDNFETAISYFNKIIDEKDGVSQNAYYHLGECYLNLDRKPEALNAFKSASELAFDQQIKEDAALNYAKLSYEEGNPYKSVAEILQEYLIQYPKSKSYNEINGLVVTSYLHQQDYQGALNYLAKKKTKENSKLTNEVSLYRGIQLFNENKLKEALPLFVKSKKSEKPPIYQKAQFWEAETNYRLENYKESTAQFIILKKFLIKNNSIEFSEIDYNIGYSYFKLKQYDKAIEWFQNFLSKEEIDYSLKDDVRLRVGDSYFASKEYRDAIKAYKNITDEIGTGADYAFYQTGISYGFLGENDKKIDALKSVVNQFETSDLKDDALYQIGNTYASIKENEQAHKAYQRVLEKHPKSAYNPSILLREGLLYYNENNNSKAIERFKETVKKYPNSTEAKQAVTNAKNVYIDTGNIDEYANWVRGIKFANVSDDDLDNITYQAAENKFLENNTQKAIEGFSKYLQSYPDGLHALKTNFYLAELLNKINLQEKAIPNYSYVIVQHQNEFTEEALNKLAQIHLEAADWKKAIPLLERLEVEANSPQNILFAESNLMKGYYESNQFKKAVEYAEKVLVKDKIESNLEYDAKIIIARAAFKTEDLQTAEEYYGEIERNATGELKAEALYFNAFFKHQNKEYLDSNKVVQTIAADYSSYKYWGLKGLIIMAKNYYKLKDAYQATYILENVIKNTQGFDDVLLDANNELKKIKTQEAKTNNSVTPQN
ncbi:tetratricopeptide repeat protein [Lutibacter sp. Hel_I_33_5]|uniref:tetratricopeptide repeat protein n=1 Tax=Lutibacter sp. Hel_I_33_5 TaxID=1566289 RepID=UPI00119CEB78|nr:tetratricopeptide repeat protein [Lutibacter sp. Hel_I_33_5]TVZ56909.1 tetratricopeptide repeat protein [Lutibacter sp. Hel_I_33_5]